ncbi:hypothetical protein EV1_039928 [Malus domestica]
MGIFDSSPDCHHRAFLYETQDLGIRVRPRGNRNCKEQWLTHGAAVHTAKMAARPRIYKMKDDECSDKC